MTGEGRALETGHAHALGTLWIAGSTGTVAARPRWWSLWQGLLTDGFSV